MELAVVIPVYNEERLLEASITRLRNSPVPEGVHRRIVLIDDGSRDRSPEIGAALAARHRDIRYERHARNKGKGGAIRTGLARALDMGADVILIHDADLEYDPADHPRVLAPILAGAADVVIGSRFTAPPRTGLAALHWAVNHAITELSNSTTGLRLTDMECCTKAMTRAVAERIDLRESRFGIEPELVAKIAGLRTPGGKPGAFASVRVLEVPVSYSGRTYEEGKKITWRDGVSALRCIMKYAPARRQP